MTLGTVGKSGNHSAVRLSAVRLDNNKGYINLCYLQKVNCKKTVRDQARISSLVKRFESE